MSQIAKLSIARSSIEDLIFDTRDLSKDVGMPATAEITIARRHLEDARMRLGVAMTMLRGEEPFSHKHKGEK